MAASCWQLDGSVFGFPAGADSPPLRCRKSCGPGVPTRSGSSAPSCGPRLPTSCTYIHAACPPCSVPRPSVRIDRGPQTSPASRSPLLLATMGRVVSPVYGRLQQQWGQHSLACAEAGVAFFVPIRRSSLCTLANRLSVVAPVALFAVMFSQLPPNLHAAPAPGTSSYRSSPGTRKAVLYEE